MKILFVFVAGLLCGAGLVWWLVPRPNTYAYRTTRPVPLFDSQGVSLGVLPEQTPLVAQEQLVDDPDAGWWALTPILFDSGPEAHDLGVVQEEGEQDLAIDLTLFATRLRDGDS